MTALADVTGAIGCCKYCCYDANSAENYSDIVAAAENAMAATDDNAAIKLQITQVMRPRATSAR